MITVPLELHLRMEITMYRNKRLINQCLSAVLILAMACVWLTGCSSTKQANRSAIAGKELKGSGFLDADLYSKMHEGTGEQFLLVYHNPKIENKLAFAKYTKIFLDPVRFYVGSSSKSSEVSKEQRVTIANAFYAQLYDKLSKDYEMVTQPGPNTFHIQVAIIDAEESGGNLEALSYIPIPVGVPGAKMALVQLDEVATGKPLFTGMVTVEGKYSDAQTGEVLAATIDRRVGQRHPIIGIFEKETYDTWHDVDEAMRYWAERLRYRFCERRGGTNCVVPKE
jgi:hypothetical protein